jgi:hypothetical protein
VWAGLLRSNRVMDSSLFDEPSSDSPAAALGKHVCEYHTQPRFLALGSDCWMSAMWGVHLVAAVKACTPSTKLLLLSCMICAVIVMMTHSPAHVCICLQPGGPRGRSAATSPPPVPRPCCHWGCLHPQQASWASSPPAAAHQPAA